MSVPDLEGWLPVRIHWQPEGPNVEWRFAGRDRLTEPFFDLTVRRLIERPYRALFDRRTSIATLEDFARDCPGIPPSGFIFHWSRCGSTLITQMLAASERNVVVSEARCVEELIWAGAWRRDLTADTLARWLRALIGALGQPRGGAESRYFVKFDALQTIALPLIRLAFPETPWIFVYRDPVEVLVSLSRRRPVFATPGMSNAGYFPLPPDQSAAMDPDEYAARILRFIASAATERLAGGDGLAVDYRDLPAAVWSKIGPHFHCEWDGEEVASMKKAALFHAKEPSLPFTEDSAAKQREAAPALRELAAQWLEEDYRRLQHLSTMWGRL
jgi:hypothetical protein